MGYSALTSIGANTYSFRSDASVDFDVFIRETCAEFCDLGDAPLKKFLAPTTCVMLDGRG